MVLLLKKGLSIDLGVETVLILVLFVTVSTSVLAQQATITSLIGRVTDTNGATIPGATIKAVDCTFSNS
jgi:hypothetical protein